MPRRRSTGCVRYRPVLIDGKPIDDIAPPRAAVGSGADARLPAAGRSGLRRAGARPGVRGRRLLRAAGQTARRYPISQAIAVGIGGRERDGGRPMSAPAVTAHAWLPRASCDASCVGTGDVCAVAPVAGGAAGSASRHAGAAVGAGDAADGGAAAGPDEGATHLLPVGAALLRCPDHGVGQPDSKPARCPGGQRAYLLAGRLLHRCRCCPGRSSPAPTCSPGARSGSWPAS